MLVLYSNPQSARQLHPALVHIQNPPSSRTRLAPEASSKLVVRRDVHDQTTLVINQALYHTFNTGVSYCRSRTPSQAEVLNRVSPQEPFHE